MKTPISELKNMTDRQVDYRIYQDIESMACSIGDLQLATEQKWLLLANYGGDF